MEKLMYNDFTIYIIYKYIIYIVVLFSTLDSAREKTAICHLYHFFDPQNYCVLFCVLILRNNLEGL